MASSNTVTFYDQTYGNGRTLIRRYNTGADTNVLLVNAKALSSISNSAANATRLAITSIKISQGAAATANVRWENKGVLESEPILYVTGSTEWNFDVPLKNMTPGTSVTGSIIITTSGAHTTIIEAKKQEGYLGTGKPS